MAMAAILAALVGMVLGQRFKVLVLAPAILFTLVLAVGAAVARAGAPLSIALTAAAAIACLQIGYLAGIGIRHLLALMRVSRLRAASIAGSMAVRHHAH